MRVVIPGGTGYIGGRLSEHLRALGHDVLVCSRRSRQWAGPSKDIEVIAVDWRDRKQVDSALAGADALVILAAANEVEAARDPVGSAEATATQCMAWVEGARRGNVGRVVYFSTIHVYGQIDGEVVTEDRLPRPLHPYASTHLAAEIYVQTAHQTSNLAATIFRLSNAFGAPVDANVDRWTLLVNDLARQVVVNGELRLNSDGTQTRDFISLDVVCGAVEWALRQPRADGDASLYNLASGQPLSVYEMACLVAQRAKTVLGRLPEINRPAPESGRRQQSPGRYDVSRLRASGFDAHGDSTGEIDALLRFCRAHFQ